MTEKLTEKKTEKKEEENELSSLLEDLMASGAVKITVTKTKGPKKEEYVLTSEQLKKRNKKCQKEA